MLEYGNGYMVNRIEYYLSAVHEFAYLFCYARWE